jgi:hypothetical protein
VGIVGDGVSQLMVHESALRTGATVAAAVGTVGAVLYALFRDLILANRRRPRLDLRFDAHGTDQVVVGTVGGFDAAYVRLRVTNEKRKDTADDVQVFVREIASQEASSDSTPIGLPLIWVGSLPPTTIASVHPGFERHIDLLHVDWITKNLDDVVQKYTEETPLQLDVHPKPAGGQHTLSAGKYEISVELVARNADAARYTVVVEWDGKWLGKDRMWEALRVQAPQKVA